MQIVKKRDLNTELPQINSPEWTKC